MAGTIDILSGHHLLKKLVVTIHFSIQLSAYTSAPSIRFNTSWILKFSQSHLTLFLNFLYLFFLIFTTKWLLHQTLLLCGEFQAV